MEPEDFFPQTYTYKFQGDYFERLPMVVPELGTSLNIVQDSIKEPKLIVDKPKTFDQYKMEHGHPHKIGPITITMNLEEDNSSVYRALSNWFYLMYNRNGIR